MRRDDLALILIVGAILWAVLRNKRRRPQLVPLPEPATPKKPAKLKPFEDFLAEVRRIESGGDYMARRPLRSGKLSQFWGAYQLGAAARKDAGVTSSWPEFAASPADQDAAARRWFELLAKRVARYPDILNAIAAGSVRGVPFDLSRAVAMAHHTGTSALRRWIRDNELASDSLGTKTVPFTKNLHGFKIG